MWSIFMDVDVGTDSELFSTYLLWAEFSDYVQVQLLYSRSPEAGWKTKNTERRGLKWDNLEAVESKQIEIQESCFEAESELEDCRFVETDDLGCCYKIPSVNHLNLKENSAQV